MTARFQGRREPAARGHADARPTTSPVASPVAGAVRAFDRLGVLVERERRLVAMLAAVRAEREALIAVAADGLERAACRMRE